MLLIHLMQTLFSLAQHQLDEFRRLSQPMHTYIQSLALLAETAHLIDHNNLMGSLEKNLDLDRLRGFTSSGPHRDDITAYFGSTPLIQSASRGENRTFMLALKIIELEILETETSKRPLLLLDDVFSELDGARRRALTNYLDGFQTLITTTDADAIMQNFAEHTNKITI